MATIFTQDDLKGRMKSPGWALITGKNDKLMSGTLEHILGIIHERKCKGQAPGLIEEIETGIQLDALQIERLWQHLGLPI